VIRVSREPVFRTLADFLDGEGYGREGRYRRSDPWQGGAPLLLLDSDTRSKPVLRSIDAGLTLLAAVSGRKLWSAEGLSRDAERGKPHPAVTLLEGQPDLVASWRSRAQVLTALVEAWHRTDLESPGQWTDQLDGCLSRLVSYPALRDLGTALMKRDRNEVAAEGFASLLAGDLPEPEEFSYVDSLKNRFYRPHTLVDLAKLLVQFPTATLVGGSAGLAQFGERSGTDWSCLISLEGIGDLRTVYDRKNQWLIGSATSLTAVQEAIGALYPALAKAIRRQATRPIRNRATLGGCLTSARPDDEIAPILMALDAMVRVISMDGERDIPVARFFEGTGKTNLRPGEFVADVILPQFSVEGLKARGAALRLCDSYLAAPRRTLAPGGMAAAFAVELDPDSRVTQAFLAYSGVSDRPVRAREAEKALVGKSWSEETVVGLLSRVSQEIESFASGPGKTFRASLTDSEQEYRRQLVITLLQKFFYQYPYPGKTATELGVIGEYLAPPAAKG
ncbi:MAG: FAD binding domain-containing protein, partial [Verrucomicrobiae bacterium]|nr:FAD binding domain-containing protein [Verrucomicrobiae bacterium]